MRSYQYLSHLTSRGIHVTAAPFFTEDHLERVYAGRRTNAGTVIRSYLNRLRALVGARKYDLVWMEKELFPFFPALAERALTMLGMPYVVDFDDALFHRYDDNAHLLTRTMLSGKIAAVMREAAFVVVGNEYLADYARRAGVDRIKIIPTVVDIDAYPVTSDAGNEVFTVGWIGTPITARYLPMISEPLSRLAGQGRIRLVVVGANVEMEGVEVECRPWHADTEVGDIARFDVGVMPLDDTPWERGKCGYKLIQYMAAGKPIVASPVGINADLVDHGRNGFHARSPDEWLRFLEHLRNPDVRAAMGREGRRTVEKQFALSVTAPRLAELLGSVVRDHRSGHV